MRHVQETVTTTAETAHHDTPPARTSVLRKLRRLLSTNGPATADGTPHLPPIPFGHDPYGHSNRFIR